MISKIAPYLQTLLIFRSIGRKGKPEAAGPIIKPLSHEHDVASAAEGIQHFFVLRPLQILFLVVATRDTTPERPDK